MTFLDINSGIMGISMLGILASVFIPGAILMTYTFKNSPGKGAVIGTVIVAIAGISISISSSIAVMEANEKAMVSNIQKKYDVDEVLLEHRGKEITPELTSGEQVYVVVDGITYEFDFEQNPDTWEPTLLDPPVTGGSSEEKTLSAEDLMR